MKHPLSHSFLVKSATISAVIVAGILVVGKFFAYRLSGSLSIEASLLDSCLDGFVSLLNFFAVKHALEPADAEHRFGHGKLEALAGLFQSLLIAGSALWLCKEIFSHVQNPQPFASASLSITVMCIASLLTLALVLWQQYVIKQTNSLAVAADCLHYKTDLLVNIAVIISILVAQYSNILIIDAITACIFSIYIFKSSFEIGKQSFDILIDRELPDQTLKAITGIVTNIKDVMGMHDLRTRSSGQRVFIQMHIDLDASLSLIQAHEVAEQIEERIVELLPNADVIIHQDINGDIHDHNPF